MSYLFSLNSSVFFRAVILFLLMLGTIRLEANSKDGTAKDSLLVVKTGLETLNRAGKLDNKGKLSLGRVYFYLAVEDKSMIEKGVEFFAGLQSVYPGEAAAYIAGFEALRAKNALWPIDKWNLAQSALGKMDKAVESHPHNIEVRFIRASTCYYLPFFFNRKDQVIQDFRVLVKLIPGGATAYPEHLIRNISRFILDSGYLSESETAVLG